MFINLVLGPKAQKAYIEYYNKQIQMENNNKEDWAPGYFKVTYVEPEFRKIVKRLEEAMRDLEQIYKSVERLRTMILSRDYTHGDLR